MDSDTGFMPAIASGCGLLRSGSYTNLPNPAIGILEGFFIKTDLGSRINPYVT
jgi:hypothetical protein